MIYIWYNPISKSYQLGALKDFKSHRNSEELQEEFLLLYKFEKHKSWLANKILSQLNAGQGETNTSIEERTLIGYIDTHK